MRCHCQTPDLQGIQVQSSFSKYLARLLILWSSIGQEVTQTISKTLCSSRSPNVSLCLCFMVGYSSFAFLSTGFSTISHCLLSELAQYPKLHDFLHLLHSEDWFLCSSSTYIIKPTMRNVSTTPIFKEKPKKKILESAKALHQTFRPTFQYCQS